MDTDLQHKWQTNRFAVLSDVPIRGFSKKMECRLMIFCFDDDDFSFAVDVVDDDDDFSFTHLFLFSYFV